MTLPPSLRSPARWLAAGLVGLMLWGGGQAFSSPTASPSSGPSPDRGMVVYQAYCVGCHGDNGRGDGPMAARLFRDFGVRPSDMATWPFQDSHDDAKLAQAIKGGGRAVHKTDYMPAWGSTLTDRQVGDLVAFIRELKTRPHEVKASMVAIGDELELGRALYTVRCLACHGSSGKGDGPFLEGLTQGGSTLAKLPNFADYETIRERSDKDFEEVVEMGVGHSGLLPSSEPGWWDRPLDDHEVRALITYLRALSLQSPSGEG